MDFAKLRQQVVAASNKLPRFDDMAAEDEYLKSEGLNVKRGGAKTEKVAREEEEDDCSVSVAESGISGFSGVSGMSGELLGVVAAVLQEKEEKERNEKCIPSPRSHAKALVEAAAKDAFQNVPATPNPLTQLDRNASATETNSIATDGSIGMLSNYSFPEDYDDHSSESEDEMDPIMDFVRKQRPTPSKPNKPSLPPPPPVITNPAPPQQPQQNTTNKKDPNRFIMELDKRSSHTIHTPIDTPSSSLHTSSSVHIINDTDIEAPPQQNNPSIFSQHSFAEAPNKLQWLTRVAKPGLQSVQQNVTSIWKNQIIAKHNSAPLTQPTPTKPAFSRTHIHTPPPEKDDEVVISNSSTLLEEEEQAELQRLLLQQNASRPGSIFVHPLAVLQLLAEQNPHYTFIFLTMMLSMLVYFYSRNRLK